jgi:dienelactone hydrolase
MKRVLAIIVIAAAASIGAVALSYWTAAALVGRAAGVGGWPGRLARASALRVSESIESISGRNGPIRVRIFRPEGGSDRSALLVSGVHPDGIQDDRLVTLARDFAAAGVVVFTPEIEDLIHYRITARATDAIEDAAVAVLGRSSGTRTQALGLVGVSFSGGLAIVAAGRTSIRDRVAYVLSFGGHGNLPRVLRYLCTGVEPAAARSGGHQRQPHDYALAIVLHEAAELAVPPDQVNPLRDAVAVFLRASTLARVSPDRAEDLFLEARARETQLPEPSRTLLKYVNDREVGALGARLRPYLNRLGQDPSLSPDQSPPPTAPVYLLHGVDDNVIPAAESTLVAEHLRRATRVRLLLSGYLTHVDVATQPTLRDTWEMVAFWRGVLGEY